MCVSDLVSPGGESFEGLQANGGMMIIEGDLNMRGCSPGSSVGGHVSNATTIIIGKS
jgi:hypothetical protein